jgi:uncharacterized protein (TIGR00369 family)
MSTLDQSVPARMLRGELPTPGIAKLIGFRLMAVAPDACTVEMDAGPQHGNPMGTLHGGVLCDLADAAMGMALATGLEDGETFTTLELKINFLKPVWSGRLQASGVIIKRGKTVSMAECDVKDAEHRLVARASCTMLTLRGEQAKGR